MHLDYFTLNTAGAGQIALDGYAVSLDGRVLGMGNDRREAFRDAVPVAPLDELPAAVLSPITVAGRSRVMDWGPAVARLRLVDGLLCTPEEAEFLRSGRDAPHRLAA